MEEGRFCCRVVIHQGHKNSAESTYGLFPQPPRRKTPSGTRFRQPAAVITPLLLPFNLFMCFGEPYPHGPPVTHSLSPAETSGEGGPTVLCPWTWRHTAQQHTAHKHPSKNTENTQHKQTCGLVCLGPRPSRTAVLHLPRPPGNNATKRLASPFRARRDQTTQAKAPTHSPGSRDMQQQRRWSKQKRRFFYT